MRTTLLALCLLGLLGGLVSTAAGAQPGATLTLSNVSHTLDGHVLVITGLVENRGQPVTGLVIDASGFSAQGDEVASGSDGIPWEVPAGGIERFSIRLSVRDRLIRDYIVRVAYARPPFAGIASARRGVELALYRALILSLVQVRGDLLGGWLIVSSRTAGLPIFQLTAEATVLFPGRRVVTLQTFTMSVPADGTITIPLGIPGAMLVVLRVTDVLLRTSWSD